MNGTELNEKVQSGLRAQYSEQRTNQIIEQAHSAYHYRNPHAKNSPELYELAENGDIDTALETLGFGKWCIGRPKLGNGLSILRAKNNGLGRSIKSVSRPLSTEGQKPLVSELFRTHIPAPGDLRKAYSEWSNSIEYRNLLVVGDQSSGKTTLVQRLAQDLAELFKPFAVESWIQTGGLDRLLIHGTKNPAKAWFLVGEDLTLTKIPRAHTNAFFQVRHLIKAQTGLREGLAVTVFNSHTLFGIDKNLRTVFRMLFVKTIPTNPHDRSILRKYFDKSLLDEFEREAGDSDVLVWDRFHQSGVWAKVPLPTRNILKAVPAAQKTQIGWTTKALVGLVLGVFLWLFVSALSRIGSVRGG